MLITLDGAGQNLERRYRLVLWSETDQWMQIRCADLIERNRKNDAVCLYLEFRMRDAS
tara:strand:+ start:283 stop:456 length:174 start_codon:yes stop_codon:yes gene_type:complete